VAASATGVEKTAATKRAAKSTDWFLSVGVD
jgi:hypothetical protein